MYSYVRNIVNIYNKRLTDHIKVSLLQAVIDAVITVVPWAWEEINTAFHGIVEAVPKLAKSPQSAIQVIGTAIDR